MENLNHQLWQMRGSAKNNCGISGFAKTQYFQISWRLMYLSGLFLSLKTDSNSLLLLTTKNSRIKLISTGNLTAP